MYKVKHIFFDLDHTLWDFDTNSKIALAEIFDNFNLKDKISSFDDFFQIYIRENELCWELYRQNKIKKDYLRSLRFSRTLELLNIHDKTLAKRIGDEYVRISPYKTTLMEGTIEVLTYLNTKYKLHIITNGFEEIQFIKLQSSKINHYFQHIITSETAGVKKPNPKIFQLALKKSNSSATETMMIGDNYEVDILGAEKIGIQGILFDPQKTKLHSNNITSLKELISIL